MKPKVTMTPILRGNVKTIVVQKVFENNPKGNTYFEGRGKSNGLIINTEDRSGALENSKPEMQLEFSCMMQNNQNGQTYAETRRLKFWFVEDLKQLDKIDGSYEFFKQLINPANFPKDYANFIKRVMTQLQLDRFENLIRVDIDFITLDQKQQDALVPQFKGDRVNEKSKELIIRENLQARLDEAYPNCLAMDDLIRILDVKENQIQVQIDELIANDVIERVEVEGRPSGFRRKICYHNEDVKVVKESEQQQMQNILKKEKPTVAIITNLLCEKLAVDAMMTDKTTFVKFEGESHVYTIGRIGTKKVISTKVAMVGRELKARISSANTTTRLLGTFQDVQHVLIVGVGGSVPHMYEFDKHSRLGDIVVSYPSEQNKPIYVFCEKVTQPNEDHPNLEIHFDIKDYCIRDMTLPTVVDNILENFIDDPASNCAWNNNMKTAMAELDRSDVDFSRPSADTDKLKLKVSEGVTFDIKHPEVPPGMEGLYLPNVPAVRLGVVGSGRPVIDDDLLRDKFAKDHFLLAYDSEYDQVLDSVKGNSLRSFILIRGVSDYIDGSHGGLWQPYASLAAAGFMKSVIYNLKD